VVNTNTTAHESITTRPAPTNGVLTKTEAGFVTNQDVVRDAVVLLLQQAKCTSTHTSTPTHPHTHIRDARSEGHIGTTTSTRHRPIKARTHVHRPAISRWADAKLHWLMQRPLAKLTIHNYVKGIQLHASLCQNLNLYIYIYGEAMAAPPQTHKPGTLEEQHRHATIDTSHSYRSRPTAHPKQASKHTEQIHTHDTTKVQLNRGASTAHTHTLAHIHTRDHTN
jgi:hypothetical protein